MIDYNAWLGHWPFRDLGDEAGTVDGWLRRMDRLGIEQSWVSPLDGVFHRVPHSANQRLSRLIQGHRDRLNPLPVFNPCLPDACRYLRVLRELFDDLRGLRVLPALLPGFPETPVTDSGHWQEMMLVWTIRLVDDRCRHPRFPLPVADPAQVLRWHDTLQPGKLVVSGCLMGELSSHAEDWQTRPAIAVESSFMDGPGCLWRAADLLGPGRLLAGSNAPLLVPEAMQAVWKLF